VRDGIDDRRPAISKSGAMRQERISSCLEARRRRQRESFGIGKRARSTPCGMQDSAATIEELQVELVECTGDLPNGKMSGAASGAAGAGAMAPRLQRIDEDESDEMPGWMYTCGDGGSGRMIPRVLSRRLLVIAAALVCTPGLGQSTSQGDDPLGGLPDRFRTKVPAILEERLADIEKAASVLPQMDRKKAYLITLPLQDYLEDVVLSGSREVTLYPRAIAWVIGREASRGASKKEIGRLLVTYYQRDAYADMLVNHPSLGVSESTGGKQQ